ncbi:MAG: LiaF domain-containing protein [Egibacteraceae bacterium]
MGGNDNRGRWRPARHTNAVALMGGVDVGLRHAVFEHAEITITAVAVMGGIDVVVPPGVEVEMTGFAFMGGNDNRASAPGDRIGPLVRVRAYAWVVWT